MSRHGHHRVRLVLSMTLSNAEAISHMAYGMLYRTYTLCHSVPCIAVRPYVHQWSRVAARIAPAIAPEKKDEGENEERRLARGKSAHLEKRAVSPSMLLLRDKVEDADIRALQPVYRVLVIVCNFLPRLGFCAWLNKKRILKNIRNPMLKPDYTKFLVRCKILVITLHILLITLLYAYNEKCLITI